MSQRPLKLPEVKELTVARKKKRDLSKITTKEFLEHDFENDTDSDVYDSDEKDKNTGMFLNISFLFQTAYFDFRYILLCR